jgi:hypothetical protein
MFIPILSAWIKQWHILPGFWINDEGGSMLAAVAIPASQTKITETITRVWIDMIDLHGLAGIDFAGLAVFTATLGALVNELPDSVPR